MFSNNMHCSTSWLQPVLQLAYIHQCGHGTGENAPQNSSNTAQPRPGYKIVIDNIDKNVKPRNMSVDAQTKSLHYVQIYSVKDRMDFGKLSDVPPSGEKCLYDILPTTDDYEKLKTNFSVHVARVMVEYIPFFSENF